MIKSLIRKSLYWLIFECPFFLPLKKKITTDYFLARKGLYAKFYDMVIGEWYRSKYLSESDPDKREALKEILMGGNSGAIWAKHYDDSPLDFDQIMGSLPYKEAWPVVVEVEAFLKNQTKPTVVIQIGSSSGREIAYLASHFSIHQFIGTDIYQEVLDYAKSHHTLNNLDFQLYSAKTLPELLKQFEDKQFVLFSSASLQYVQPEHLDSFFKEISEIKNIHLFLTEPVEVKENNFLDLEGSRWRGNFSYSHNYGFYAKKHGTTVKTEKIIKPYFPAEKYPQHAHTEHFFLAASTQ